MLFGRSTYVEKKALLDKLILLELLRILKPIVIEKLLERSYLRMKAFIGGYYSLWSSGSSF